MPTIERVVLTFWKIFASLILLHYIWGTSRNFVQLTKRLTIFVKLILSKLGYALYSEIHKIDKLITANYFLPLSHHIIMRLTFIIILHLPYVNWIHYTITGPVNDRTRTLPHTATAVSSFQNYIQRHERIAECFISHTYAHSVSRVTAHWI